MLFYHEFILPHNTLTKSKRIRTLLVAALEIIRSQYKTERATWIARFALDQKMNTCVVVLSYLKMLEGRYSVSHWKCGLILSVFLQCFSPVWFVAWEIGSSLHVVTALPLGVIGNIKFTPKKKKTGDTKVGNTVVKHNHNKHLQIKQILFYISAMSLVMVGSWV